MYSHLTLLSLYHSRFGSSNTASNNQHQIWWKLSPTINSLNNVPENLKLAHFKESITTLDFKRDSRHTGLHGSNWKDYILRICTMSNNSNNFSGKLIQYKTMSYPQLCHPSSTLWGCKVLALTCKHLKMLAPPKKHAKDIKICMCLLIMIPSISFKLQPGTWFWIPSNSIRNLNLHASHSHNFPHLSPVASCD